MIVTVADILAAATCRIVPGGDYRRGGDAAAGRALPTVWPTVPRLATEVAEASGRHLAAVGVDVADAPQDNDAFGSWLNTLDLTQEVDIPA